MGGRRKSGFHLPTRVYMKRGKPYYVTASGRWVALDMDNPYLIDQAKHLRLVRATPDGKGFKDLRTCFERCRKNARHRDIGFLLTWDDVVAMWQRSEGRCELSGLAFVMLADVRFKNRPFAPSIDRIDNSLGYSMSNCRLVCIAVNLALNEWGLETLQKIAAGLHKRRRILDMSKKSAESSMKMEVA